ncbi:AAA family ATPase [Hoeflea sp. YIM 152468]|uniref:AAA family ATPase n=1 Tax=Hoeflea sp. YIM 152468 TaxID=3031759 RepID=UPI0023DB09CF|nr:AAA family ATPase [Hoeflea sp. YIM 152468]MDF1609420.1 AAA family ATPase [Hoeflea sp. YIM 152468]
MDRGNLPLKYCFWGILAMNEIGNGDDVLAALGAAVEKRPQTTIWSELNAWGKSIADWQRYIISHAVRDGTLSDDRIEEAYRLFLRDRKLDSGDEELPDVPSSVTGRVAAEGTPLTLRTINSLKNVNAIPEFSRVTFGPQLTVIYGHNGAGKSGFARILSSACFSRSSPQIIRNIYDDDAPNVPATAQFEIDRGNGSDEEINFTDGDENDDLKRVSVFDSSVARIHLAKENELGFQPAGFDVFDEAIRVISLITQKLEADINAKTRLNKFDQLFADPGPVATKIASLNAKSDIAELKLLATFGEAEKERLDELARQEQELIAKSPVETLRALATAKTDIETLQKKVGELASTLGNAACDKARQLLDGHRAALLEAVQAGSATVSHPQLCQTGSTDWDNFVLASRKLGHAEAVTYPADGDPCLLCHRPLDAPSATLISRMWGYLDHKARKAAVVADEELNRYVTQLKALDCALLPGESRIRADLSKMDPALVAEVDAASVTFDDRRKALVAALEQGAVGSLPEGDLVAQEETLAKALENIRLQDVALRGGKFDEILAKLKVEHIALRQKQVLSKNIDDVVAFVEDMAWTEKAGASRPKTRFVTDCQKAIFEKLIEGNYKDRLKDECVKLDCSLPIEFKARGSAGKTLRGLKAKGGHKPDDIFSEGEQRALSLADFLTEVNLNPTSAAIVLDDPVTSLDHQRKRLIAKRLAEEASVRQVIVFTHDLVFLTLLSDKAEAAGCEVMSHWVQRLEGVPGCVKIEDTPANGRIYRKTTKAKEFLQQAKQATGGNRVDFVRSGAGALRRTIEEVVILYLFKDTVRRWDEQVRLGALIKISWSNDLADEIVALQDDTSRLLEGHSNSDEFAGEVPEVEDLERLIARVDDVINIAKAERS